MPGDPIWPNTRDTADDLRKKWPTSVAFLRDMATCDFYPLIQDRFTEAADDLEATLKELGKS